MLLTSHPPPTVHFMTFLLFAISSSGALQGLFSHCCTRACVFLQLIALAFVACRNLSHWWCVCASGNSFTLWPLSILRGGSCAVPAAASIQHSCSGDAGVGGWNLNVFGTAFSEAFPGVILVL